MKKYGQMLAALLMAGASSGALAAGVAGYDVIDGVQALTRGTLNNNVYYGISNMGKTGTITHSGDLSLNNNGYSGLISFGHTTLNMNGGTLFANSNEWVGHDEGYGIISIGDKTLGSASVTVNNANVVANNNAFSGIWSQFGAEINLNGNGHQTVSAKNNYNAARDNGSGMSANGSKATINITDMDVDLIGNAYGMVTQDGIINIIGNGDTDLNVSSSVKSGVYALYGGTVDVSGMDDVEINNNGGYGIVAENASNISIAGNDSVEIRGNKSGAISAANNSTVALENAYIDGLISAADSNISMANSKWNISDASHIKNFEGVDTTLVIGGAEMLTVDTMSGNFNVIAKSADGKQFADGTQLINVNGGGAEFLLLSGAAGATVQELDSTGMISDTGVVTEAFASAADSGALQLTAVHTAMNNLRKRMGTLRGGYYDNNSGFWTRAYAKNAKVNIGNESEMNIYGAEVGYDYKIMNRLNDSIYIGVTAGYQEVGRLRTKQSDGFTGRGDASTPTVGAYATWINTDGWFADVTARYLLMGMDLDTRLATGGYSSIDIDRSFIATSAEFGRRFDFKHRNSSINHAFALEPKVEVQYVWGNSGNEKTNYGFELEYDSINSLVGRGALAGVWSYYPGTTAVVDFFAELGYSYEFLAKSKGSFAGVGYKADMTEGMFEASIGTTVWMNNGLNFYGEVGYEKSDIVRGVFGNLGFRYNF